MKCILIFFHFSIWSVVLNLNLSSTWELLLVFVLWYVSILHLFEKYQNTYVQSYRLEIRANIINDFFKIPLQLMYCATVYYGPATAIEGGKIHSKTLEGPPIPLPVVLSTIRFIPTRSLLILLTARSVLILLECFLVILKFAKYFSIIIFFKRLMNVYPLNHTIFLLQSPDFLCGHQS